MLENAMQVKQELLSKIPQVDEILKSSHAQKWLESYPRKIVLRAVREVLDSKRRRLLEGQAEELSADVISEQIESRIKKLAAYKLRPLVNATGIVIHTNLGRAVISDKAIENIRDVAGSYSNLEYDIPGGERGKRYSHIRDILVELTGAEDAIAVNNNAAAVLLCLNTFAKGGEVIVSRGELVEIGGSFRIPEVMKASGAILKEAGTTNKTHLSDYKNALCGNTALLLKVHQSNYKVIGFTEEVSIEKLVKLGKEFRIPVMADLGSGCMIDLEKYGIYGEPTVQNIIRTGADIVTFSGDKLLGGPQAGIILGKTKFIQKIQKNPLLRAIRIDKLTLASLEATFMQYLDEEKAVKEIPTLRMLTESPDIIRRRARKIFTYLKKDISNKARIEVAADQSQAGGGSLPEVNFPTFAVSIKPANISVNELEKRLRLGNPPVIARIKEDTLLIDARTVQDREIKGLVGCVRMALFSEEQKMIYYFAYGSNMDKEDLEKWCKNKGYPEIKFLSTSPAKLSGYRLSFNYFSTTRNAGAANIMGSKSDYVYGLLIKIVESGLETIRKKEGYPKYYNEICVDVEKFDKTVVSNVKTYKVVKDREKSDHQPPTKNYMQLIIKNSKKYNFPSNYIEFLETIKTKD